MEAQLAQQQQLMTQSELFKSYADSNELFLNLTNNMQWFEFGGNKIGRLFTEGAESSKTRRTSTKMTILFKRMSARPQLKSH